MPDSGSLRAATLGANDGILSTASVMLGIAGASTDHGHLLLGGAAALVAGAMSMAAGEYISVSTQRELEQSELTKERRELPNPIAAAFSSATSFVAGGVLPLAGALISPATYALTVIVFSSVTGLLLLGYLTGKFGAGVSAKAIWRTLFWGVAAMGVTYAAGHLLGRLSV